MVFLSFLFCFAVCLFDLFCFKARHDGMCLSYQSQQGRDKDFWALAGQPALLGGHLLLRVDSGDGGGNCNGDVK